MASVIDAVKTTFVGISDGVKNANFDEGVKSALIATIVQLFIITDLMAGLSANLSVMASDKSRFEGELKSVMHSAGIAQGAVETFIKQQESKGSGGGGYRRHNVLESKAVSNLKMVGGDKTGFRAWHERLVNIMEQIRPGSRGTLRALVGHVDHEMTEDFNEWIKNDEEYEEVEET